MNLSVIHLSDIHISSNKDKIFDRLEKLKQACASSIPINGTVVLAITGDIANTGKNYEYENSKTLITSIAEYIKEQREADVYFAFAPGNHDCNFTKDNTVRSTLIDSVKSTQIDKTYYDSISFIQEEYFDFAKSYTEIENDILSKFELEVDERKFLFLMVNTAWMSTLNEKPGKLIIPEYLFDEVKAEEYDIVFYMYHHPLSWLNPDYKKGFIDHIRNNADIVLCGHEHEKDNYSKSSNSFFVFCNHGKELQDNETGGSGFSILNFDNAFQTYEIIDYGWNGDIYKRENTETQQYHKNIASKVRAFCPNFDTLNYIEDIGITVHHFAKEDIKLQDLFIWPDLRMLDYKGHNRSIRYIRENISQEIFDNSLSVIVGASSVGKTSLAKMLYIEKLNYDLCCVLLHGSEFTSSDEKKISSAVESSFINQYSAEQLEFFRQLPKEKRIVIVDDFDSISFNNKRRCKVLEYLCNYFDKVIVLISSNIEIASILTSDRVRDLSELAYYEILPLGNRKRRELISKWYTLNNDFQTDEEINNTTEKSQVQINIFLGNGAAYIPALPAVIIGILQNADAVTQSFSGSKYGFLYESLINKSLSMISADYTNAGEHNIDINVLSLLAYDMLCDKRTNFSEEQLEKTIKRIGEDYILSISAKEFLRKMNEAQIIYKDISEGEVYKFRYPYIFYYFSGRYIAYNLDNNSVKTQIEYMSERLFNETYGNIVVFVCHFASSSEVIDNVIINAYTTLEDYSAFDFTKENPIFEDMKEAVALLVPKTIAGNDKVVENKEKQLRILDEAGINDGQVAEGEACIEDDLSDIEKDMAAVTSALKTIEVLGQILQNYPIAVKSTDKLDAISEMHKLGMRSVQAIIDIMGRFENELVEHVYKETSAKEGTVKIEDVEKSVHKLINLLVSGMAGGMIHQIALALNSKHILPAAKQAFEKTDDVSAKLLLIDLEVNCLKKVDYREIKELKEELIDNKEIFASGILDSIVGQYLNYNSCNHVLRSKLCNLCGFSESKVLIAERQNLLD